MLRIVGVMLAGLLVGWLIGEKGSQRLTFTSKVISILVLLLLFSLGVEVGGSEEVMSNLPKLGGSALVIAMMAMAGAVLMAWMLHRRDQGRKGGAEDEG